MDFMALTAHDAEILTEHVIAVVTYSVGAIAFFIGWLVGNTQ